MTNSKPEKNQTGNHFIDWRHKNAPAWLYQGLHALPAMLWSIAMPFQHIASIRKRYPSVHRGIGYFILAGSLVLSLTGYTLVIRDIAHSHADPWHMHDLNGVSPIPWPTFEATLWALGPVYLLTLFKTATAARRKDFQAHERWAVLHTVSAYVISLERLVVLASYIVGFALAAGVDKEWLLKKLNDLPDTVAAKAEVEMDIFALASVFAFIMAVLWLAYVWAEAGRLSLPWQWNDNNSVGKEKKVR